MTARYLLTSGSGLGLTPRPGPLLWLARARCDAPGGCRQGSGGGRAAPSRHGQPVDLRRLEPGAVGAALDAFRALLAEAPKALPTPTPSTPRSTPATPASATSTATAAPPAGATPGAGASSPATAAWRSSRGCRSTRPRRGPSASSPGATPRRACLPEASLDAPRRPPALLALALGRAAHPPRRPPPPPPRLQPHPAALRRRRRLNPRRNADEISLLVALPRRDPVPTDDAGVPPPLPDEPVVVLGNLNADPFDGAGGCARRIAALLAHPRLQDPRPASPGGAAAADPGQAGPPGPRHRRLARGGPRQPPHRLRPALARPRGRASGVFWPAPGDPLAEAAAAASAHRLVWVDLALP